MVDQAPLSRAYIDGGAWTFAAVAMAWMGFHGAVFAMLSAACAIVIPHRIIALVAPLALVVVQSLGAAILNYGSVSWMVTALYPNGMQRILPLEALAPTLILLALVSACLAVFIVRAPSSPKFS